MMDRLPPAYGERESFSYSVYPALPEPATP